jgi:UDP-N-acetylglucosamine--N-acetylmuramyl-(pentapeptide) pyrophosphoryl-undecaprenol N-acetylglucosamine transferase
VGRTDLVLATSGGGHLELLRAVEHAWAGFDHVVVTPPGPRADAVRRAGHAVEAVPETARDPRRLVRSALRSVRLALALRPRVVVTAGAAAAVPFCLAARLLGARLVLVETMARVDSPSTAGRLLGPIAGRVLVQWPELRAAHPRALVCRPALLEPGARGERALRGEGTLVAVGTHEEPFDRLLELADRAVAAGVLPAPALAQAGASTRPYSRLRTVRALPPEELERAVAASEVVVCHGGSGIVSLAVRAGHRPLVLARRESLAEHVDDHQVATVAKLASLGLVVSLDEHPVERAVELARDPAPPAALAGEPLAAALRAAIEDELARPRGLRSATVKRLLVRAAGALPDPLVRSLARARHRSPAARRLLDPLVRRARSVETEIREGPARGLRFDPAGSAAQFSLGTAEPEVQAALAELLSPGDVLWDVGANVGFFTLIGARAVGERGRVFAFEPVPELAAAARRNAELNGFRNVEVVERAAAAEAGRAEFVLSQEPGWGRLAAVGAPKEAQRTIAVETAALDELVERGELAPPAVVKIDVEGAEVDAIAGMRETLRRHRPLVLCELHGTNREFAAAMRELGYEPAPLTGDGPIEDAEPTAHALARPARG